MSAETQIDFAARLGVSRSYITQLKQADRLVMTAAGLVDVEASMAADPKNIDTLLVRGRVREAMRLKAGN